MEDNIELKETILKDYISKYLEEVEDLSNIYTTEQENLFKNNKIEIGDLDKLNNESFNLIDEVIKAISKCPYLKIVLN